MTTTTAPRPAARLRSALVAVAVLPALMIGAPAASAAPAVSPLGHDMRISDPGTASPDFYRYICRRVPIIPC